MTALWILVGWLLLSVPVSIAIGKFIAFGQAGDMSRYLANPTDEADR